ncbi:hypothetical protein [Oceanospirillum sediminis]|uniref:Bor family protein n=1 Tax=Oceanospirillum sediminis TaxID=2760088 RepID=A0A839IPF8_9GAMM|nr:hypothetical protein [Oceanospirillum sediminis]MBB1486811.1 hypothetical protein [Oceanospirillum sediminis]
MTITSRKSMVPVVVVVSSALLLSACSTMKFVNGPEMEQTTEREQWHHLGLNGVVEFSRPMNLKYNCAQQQWDTATIEYSFLNMIASVSPAVPVTLYNPWTIIYECREPID